jgi:hypothetical protein
MIDESAIIRSSYVNPNLIQRQSPEEIAYMAGFSDNRSVRPIEAFVKRIGEGSKNRGIEDTTKIVTQVETQ